VSSVWITAVPVVLVDAVAAMAALLLAGWLCGGMTAGYAFQHALPAIPIAIACLAAAGLYPGVMRHPVDEWRRIFWCSAGPATYFATVCYFHSAGVLAGAATHVTAWAGMFLATIGLRTASRQVLGRCSWWGVDTLVVAGAPHSSPLLRLLGGRVRDHGLNVVQRFGGAAERTGARQNRGADQRTAEYALIATPGLRADDLSAIVREYGRFRRVFVMWDMGGIADLETATGSAGDLFGVSVRHNQMCTGPRIIKRSVDLMVVCALGLVLMPFLAAIWVIVKLSSPGSGFYGHRRIGQGGRYFTVWKFRTMVLDADRVLEDWLQKHPELRQEWLLTHKLKFDPRKTGIGRILRRTSLDELPQLWNVFRGDMSLVGPRPIVDSETEKYGDDYPYYLQVRPGVTGLWQVSGRNNTSYPERVAFDRSYVRNWSVWLDFYILARTVRTVLTGHGAY
jgi:Undecaprenyl-phosphate galactose phosphotransferase WbaP